MVSCIHMHGYTCMHTHKLTSHTYIHTTINPLLQTYTHGHMKEFIPSKYIRPCYLPSSNLLFTTTSSYPLPPPVIAILPTLSHTHTHKINVLSLYLPVSGLLPLMKCPTVPSILLWMAGLDSCQWLGVTPLRMCICSLPIHTPLDISGQFISCKFGILHTVNTGMQVSHLMPLFPVDTCLLGDYVIASYLLFCCKLLYCFP